MPYEAAMVGYASQRRAEHSATGQRSDGALRRTGDLHAAWRTAGRGPRHKLLSDLLDGAWAELAETEVLRLIVDGRTNAEIASSTERTDRAQRVNNI